MLITSSGSGGFRGGGSWGSATPPSRSYLAETTGSAIALCILKAQEVTTKGVYRLPHTIVVSPRQTLRGGLPRLVNFNSPAHQLAVRACAVRRGFVN